MTIISERAYGLITTYRTIPRSYHKGFHTLNVIIIHYNHIYFTQCVACLAKVILFTIKYCPKPVTSRPGCSVLLALPK